MKKGDKIIWDSHFGYDIGYFVGEGHVYFTYEVDLMTGIIQEKTCLPKTEIKPYSKELIIELSKKYGYKKDFVD